MAIQGQGVTTMPTQAVYVMRNSSDVGPQMIQLSRRRDTGQLWHDEGGQVRLVDPISGKDQEFAVDAFCDTEVLKSSYQKTDLTIARAGSRGLLAKISVTTY